MFTGGTSTEAHGGAAAKRIGGAAKKVALVSLDVDPHEADSAPVKIWRGL